MKHVSFLKALEHPTFRSHDLLKVFNGFLLLAACALSCQQYEDRYLEEVQRWSADEMALFSQALGALVQEMEDRRPFEDLLGPVYMELNSRGGRQLGGEYYTPQNVAHMMADLNLANELPEDGPITVHEPACGSGVMVLALAQCLVETHQQSPTRLRVQAWDISRTGVLMAYINFTLWGIPAEVVHGNTLSLEHWSVWRTPVTPTC